MQPSVGKWPLGIAVGGLDGGSHGLSASPDSSVLSSASAGWLFSVSQCDDPVILLLSQTWKLNTRGSNLQGSTGFSQGGFPPPSPPQHHFQALSCSCLRGEASLACLGATGVHVETNAGQTARGEAERDGAKGDGQTKVTCCCVVMAALQVGRAMGARLR